MYEKDVMTLFILCVCIMSPETTHRSDIFSVMTEKTVNIKVLVSDGGSLY